MPCRAASTSPSPARTGLDGRARHVRRWASATPAQTARARSSRLRRGRRSAGPVGSSSTGPTRWQTPARESTVRPTGTQRDRETALRKLTARPGSSGAGHWLHLRHGDKIGASRAMPTPRAKQDRRPVRQLPCSSPTAGRSGWLAAIRSPASTSAEGLKAAAGRVSLASPSDVRNRPIWSVPLPRSARSLFHSRRRAAGDRLGDEGLAPSRAGPRGCRFQDCPIN